MSNNFHYFRSELKSKSILRYKFVGIVSEIILSTEIFPKNDNLNPFVKGIFNIEYKEYVFYSRTTVVARITRLIYKMNENEYEVARRSLLIFVLELMTADSKNIKKRQQPSFSKWIEGILNEK